MANVLVIEDQLDMALLVEYLLDQNDHRVFIATDGEDGLEILAEEALDLVILDIMMPGLDGWEVCKRIRERSDIPIMIVTAKTAEKDIVYGLQIGADEYITKPFSTETFGARVEALLRRDKLKRHIISNEIEKLKHSITSVVSHELRTPLSLITGSLDLAMREAFRGDQDAQKEFLKNARENALIMRWLVDDLITIARIDQGLEIFRKPIHLKNEMEMAARSVEPFLGKHEIYTTCKVDEEITISVDKALFRQALLHLLVNAVKFSPNGEVVHFSARLVNQESLSVKVADQGLGIPTELQEKIFERYYQVDGGDYRAYGGLGVGLHIARAIAQAHGGNLTVKSNPGSGSVFEFLILRGPPDWEEN